MVDVNTIGVLGAGTMGTGIAQLASLHGHEVILVSAIHAAIPKARAEHQRAMKREVDKGRLTSDEAEAVLSRISYVEGAGPEQIALLGGAAFVIEAVTEQLQVKQDLFRAVEDVVGDEVVLATNTSSLPVTAIAGVCRRPERVVGMHFFNPAPVMPLVEIVPALTSGSVAVAGAERLATRWKKVTVRAADTPGFLVNRVARPFYGESLRIREEQMADPATIDWALKSIGGFRMGPFELMDFIGLDVNYAVTRSVYEGLFHEPRYRPSLQQQRLVEAGWLGRKSGRGFYDYADGAVRPEPVEDARLGSAIVDRVLAMLVNEAVDFVHLGLGSVDDVERAMTAGVNYPRGLLEWGDELGPDRVLAQLDALHQESGDPRYRASVRLRRIVASGESLKFVGRI